jgi:hypothetical protein
MSILTRKKRGWAFQVLAIGIAALSLPAVNQYSNAEHPPPAQAAAGSNAASMQPGPAPGAATAEELQQLLSPIALYPDLLIAQILAASTYPTQVVEADRFMKENPNLTGDALANKVNPQAWDPSVKSLCQFPSVLSTMSQSLTWTTTLGEAYYNQPSDVLAAIQAMRKRAMDAGTLKSTPQQKVEVQNAPAPPPAQEGAEQPAQPAQPAQQQVVVIQPTQPNTVYVPSYNPSTVYGAPVAQPEGYSGTEVMAAGVLGFGAGILMGSLINDGHNDWGCGWYGGGGVVYNRNVWVSNSALMAGRYGYGRAGYPGYRGGYGRAGYPRATPYSARGQFAANNPALKPNFPKAGDLGGRAGNRNGLGDNRGDRLGNRGGNLGDRGGNFGNRGGNLGDRGNLGANRPGGGVGARPGGGSLGGSRPGGGNLAANRPESRPANNPMRGYGGAGGGLGSRGGAFGGYQSGGFAQASSMRGRSSFGGGGGFGGGGRGFGGGGGRGFGGGGRGGRGGGRGRR